MKRNVKKKKGFTLIELIIVISIIAVLAAIAVPKYASIQKDAKVKADIATAKTIADAVTVLVAQEKVSETISSAVEIETGAEDVNAIAIGSYLESIPTSAVNKGKNFKVKVSAGIAAVYVEDIEVYPNGTDPYGPAIVIPPATTP